MLQYHTGVCYKTGDGVPRDLNECIYWVHKAALAGYAVVQAAPSRQAAPVGRQVQ